MGYTTQHVRQNFAVRQILCRRFTSKMLANDSSQTKLVSWPTSVFGTFQICSQDPAYGNSFDELPAKGQCWIVNHIRRGARLSKLLAKWRRGGQRKSRV